MRNSDVTAGAGSTAGGNGCTNRSGNPSRSGYRLGTPPWEPSGARRSSLDRRPTPRVMTPVTHVRDGGEPVDNPRGLAPGQASIYRRVGDTGGRHVDKSRAKNLRL